MTAPDDDDDDDDGGDDDDNDDDTLLTYERLSARIDCIIIYSHCNLHYYC